MTTSPTQPGGAGAVQGAPLAAAVAGLVLLTAALLGYAAVLAVVAALVLLLAATWPVLAGSRTPAAAAVLLAVSGLVLVAASVSAQLRWVAGAVALGILLSFLHQIGRRAGREGLVVTLLASFAGLVLMASGALLAGLGRVSGGRDLLVVTMASVVVGVVPELLAGAVGHGAGRPSRSSPDAAGPGGEALTERTVVAGAVGLLALSAGLLLRRHFGALPGWEAALLGGLAGLGSWAFRRVTSLPAALSTRRGQLASGIGSVLLVGALPQLLGILS